MPDMEAATLTPVLAETTAALADLAGVLEAQTGALHRGEPAAVLAAIARARDLCRRLDELEQQRLALAPAARSLSALVSAWPEPARARGEDLLAQCRQHLQRIAAANAGNQHLAADGLEFAGRYAAALHRGATGSLVNRQA